MSCGRRASCTLLIATWEISGKRQATDMPALSPLFPSPRNKGVTGKTCKVMKLGKPVKTGSGCRYWLNCLTLHCGVAKLKLQLGRGRQLAARHLLPHRAQAVREVFIPLFLFVFAEVNGVTVCANHVLIRLVG